MLNELEKAATGLPSLDFAEKTAEQVDEYAKTLETAAQAVMEKAKLLREKTAPLMRDRAMPVRGRELLAEIQKKIHEAVATTNKQLSPVKQLSRHLSLAGEIQKSEKDFERISEQLAVTDAPLQQRMDFIDSAMSELPRLQITLSRVGREQATAARSIGAAPFMAVTGENPCGVKELLADVEARYRVLMPKIAEALRQAKTQKLEALSALRKEQAEANLKRVQEAQKNAGPAPEQNGDVSMETQENATSQPAEVGDVTMEAARPVQEPSSGAIAQKGPEPPTLEGDVAMPAADTDAAEPADGDVVMEMPEVVKE